MDESYKTIEDQALQLPSRMKLMLAEKLLQSLGEHTLSDVESAWVKEAESRYQAYKAGERPGISAEDVMSQADELLRKR